MGIKDELLTIAEGIAEIKTRFYGTDFEANAKETESFPLCHIQTIQSGVLQSSGIQQTIYQRRPVYIFFGDKTDINNTTEQNDEIIQRMTLLAARFLHNVNKSGKFDHVAEMPLKSHQFRFDYLVCGVVGMLNLRDKQAMKFC